MTARIPCIPSALRVPSALEWALLLLGLGLTWRYFWFMDDAFVYFRYVDNLLWLGRGLVFNPGEYVEGYSSPLWTLLLIPLRATTLDYYVSLRGAALVCCALFWATSVWLNQRLSPPGPRISLGTAFAMTHYGVLAYFSSGLETPLVQLAACAFAVLALKPASRAWQLVVGLAPLIRPELAVPTLVLGLGLWWSERRFPRWLFGSALSFGCGWLVFRIYYYADLFPNTYYLKDQTDLSQGYYYFVYSLGSHYLPAVAALLTLAAAATWWLKRRALPPQGNASSAQSADTAPVSDASSQVASVAQPPPGARLGPRALLTLAALSSLVYPMKVGGDMVYYRFLAFAVCLGLLLSAGLLEHWFALLRPSVRRHRRWAAPLLGALLATFSLLRYPSALSAHPATLQAKVAHFHGISDGAWHRQLPDLAPNPQRAAYDAERRSHYRKATIGQRSGARVEIGGWCAADYRKWDRTLIHEWGLTEPVLARASVKSDRPGHKYGLKPLARSLLPLRRRALAEGSAGPGMYAAAVRAGYAPKWVSANLDAIQIIEKKAYNRHHFWENLALATQRPQVQIPPPPSPPARVP